MVLLNELTGKIHPSWNEFFQENNDELIKIIESIEWEEKSIFPPKESIFKVFEMDINEIKVVFLGQDPYHGFGQAMGLSFSVPENAKIQPSLYNIFKELKLEYPERNYYFASGDLTRWFNEEKIFLLNSALTVVSANPGSHLKKWSNFTNNVIKYISEINDKTVFLLLGAHAKNKINFIKIKSNCICGVHPSPLSASKGFFNSNIFKEVERVCGENIDWRI